MNYVYINKDTNNIEAFCTIRDDIFEEMGGLEHFPPEDNMKPNQIVVVSGGNLEEINLCVRKYSFDYNSYTTVMKASEEVDIKDFFIPGDFVEPLVPKQGMEVEAVDIESLHVENKELKERLRLIEEKLNL